jgi:predicted nucleic acid-binding protein
MRSNIIDPNLLPLSAAIDTGVFMRGLLGDRPDEPRSPMCKAFCDAMIEAGRTLFVAAPFIAEVTRYKGERIPRRRGVVVVPFDDVAAEQLGLRLPMAKLQAMKSSTVLPLTYLKYDALILACAIRCRAAVLVAIDGDHDKLARATGFDVSTPEAFQQTQPTLFDLFERTGTQPAAPTILAVAESTIETSPALVSKPADPAPVETVPRESSSPPPPAAPSQPPPSG